VNAPRLAVLVGTHRSAQSLMPCLQQSRFVLTHHCLEPAQLQDAIDAGAVDVALVSTGPRGLDAAALAALGRREIPLVVLDAQPHHQRWAHFAGVVLTSEASIELVLTRSRRHFAASGCGSRSNGPKWRHWTTRSRMASPRSSCVMPRPTVEASSLP